MRKRSLQPLTGAEQTIQNRLKPREFCHRAICYQSACSARRIISCKFPKFASGMTSLGSRSFRASSTTSATATTTTTTTLLAPLKPVTARNSIPSPSTNRPERASLRLSEPSLRCDRLEMHTSASSGYSIDNHVATKDTIVFPDPKNSSLSDLCALLHDKVSAFLESPAPSSLLKEVQRQTTISLDVLKEALDNYSIDELALSYNGGKDCLVLLILWLVTLHRHFGRSRSASTSLSTVANAARSQEAFPTSIPSIYIQPQYPFSEVDDFVAYSAQKYHLDLTTLTNSMKAAFTEYLSRNPNIKAIFVGTRRTDPHGATLGHFNSTDCGWPDFMRCQPVIDWHYREIWAFIRYFQIPYCLLYDLGYTSLGGTNDTRPNPRLKINTSSSEEASATYRPAYELFEDDDERLGRP